jgi:hypothetical protein
MHRFYVYLPNIQGYSLIVFIMSTQTTSDAPNIVRRKKRRVGAPKKPNARSYPVKTHEDPTKPLRDPTAERFALLVSIGIDGQPPMCATDAYIAVRPEVAEKNRDYIRSRSSIYRNQANINARVEHLKEQLWKSQVLTISRRKQLLSRLAEDVIEADPSDYLEAGADGSYVSFGRESPRRIAVESIKSRTVMSGEGNQDGAVITDLKLVPKQVGVAAIKELNAMDHVYEVRDPGEKVAVAFIVMSDAFANRAKRLVRDDVVDVES